MSHHQQHQPDQRPIVHHSNGTFLVFKSEHAKLLRCRHRILSQPLASGAPSSTSPVPPYCISHYAAHLIATRGLAQFMHLDTKRDISMADNKVQFGQSIEQLKERERQAYIENRMLELRRHKIELTAKTLGEFDPSKMRLIVQPRPDRVWASYDEKLLSDIEALAVIMRDLPDPMDRKRMQIYHDLYGFGFYISSGLKFGSDFLAYTEDPIECHAQFAIRLVHSDSSGKVDLTRTDFVQLNCLQRLTHTANKIPLFATIDDSPLHKVRYWTLKERIYLNPNSVGEDLELVEPRVDSSSCERIKLKRTS